MTAHQKITSADSFIKTIGKGLQSKLAAPSSKLQVGLVIDDTDNFILPIERELQRRHRVTRFTPKFWRVPLIGSRVNEFLLDRQLKQFIQANDVVLFEWAASLLVRATKLETDGRVVTRLHLHELESTADQIRWDGVQKVIVVSQAVSNRLRSITGVREAAVQVIPNGVDLEQLSSEQRIFNYRIGTACHLIPRKRVYELIHSLHRLRVKGLPFTLHIAGDVVGSERGYAWALEHLVDRLELGDYVKFHGFVADMPRWLREIDIFISNSYWEGQQVALLEAMASECYCLSHCWQGAEEVLPSENIFATEDEMLEKVDRFANLDVDQRHLLQAKMRAKAEKQFDQRRMVDGIINILEEVAVQ